MKTYLRLAFMLALVSALLQGCSSTPATRLYLLTALEPAEVSAKGGGEPMLIGLGPVSLPDYLDRPQIIVRLSTNRLEAAAYHRWAEPLESGVARVLIENLAARLPDSRIIAYPWNRTEDPTFQVRIEVLRFDAGPDEAVHLVARWSVNRRNGGTESAPELTDLAIPASTSDFEELVRAESRGLLLLSQEIAAELQRMAAVSD